MPRTSKIVKVPRPKEGSFNKNRRAGKLLQAQVAHLRSALIKHHAEVQALLAFDPSEVRTEGEVGKYVERVTAVLHNRGTGRSGK